MFAMYVQYYVCFKELVEQHKVFDPKSECDDVPIQSLYIICLGGSYTHYQRLYFITIAHPFPVDSTSQLI